MTKEKTVIMRGLLARPGLLVIPGVGDALGAKIVEEAGFDVVYMGGHAVVASYGKPDLGLLTMTEVVSRAASIVEAVDIPVICDSDAGYGSAINVIRTVRQFQRAGVAGIHLEDQDSPKRCGAFAGKQLISTEEMVGKIRAATDARTDEDFIIIARTDAVAVEGMAEAVARGHAYEEAGADVIMVQIPRTLDEVRIACTSFSKPALLTVSESGVQPVLPFAELEAMGLKIALLPLTLMISVITVMRRTIRQIKELGDIGPIIEQNDSWDSVLSLLNTDNIIRQAEFYHQRGTTESHR